MPSRRSLCAAIAAVILSLTIAACAPAPRTSRPPIAPATSTPTTPSPPTTSRPIPNRWPTIVLQRRWTGLSQPVEMVAATGTADLFVLEQGGRVRLIRDGRLLPKPYLDISGRISSGGERGLLGIAFPAGFASTGRFYVHYTAPNGDAVFSRFHAAPGAATADAASEKVVLTIPHNSHPNHNAGAIVFGPDGYLYAGMGDGGGEGDPNGNGQNTGVLLGKLLRLDVEGVDAGRLPATYDIPRTNPFRGSSLGKPEIWSWGLRNPWKFSFDRDTGELYIADVGQDAWEEIDHAKAGDTGSENYGWNVWEGDHPFPPGTSPGRDGFTFPVAEYGHDQGNAVVGGYVYRGERQPALWGTYLFTDNGSGRMWGLRHAANGWTMRRLLDTGLSPSSFGEDGAGELYLLDLTSGNIYSITAR